MVRERPVSAIGFDTLKFARKLKEAGVPAQQAEAQAEVLGEAFLYNLDEIVTRDYLDARLSKLEERFVRIDGQFRLLYWMLGLIIVVNVIPILTGFLG